MGLSLRPRRTSPTLLKLPASFKSVAAIPGKGGKVTAAFISYSAPVTPHDQNLYWQEFEKRLGIIYEPNIIAADSYKEKMAALIAGGDLPDHHRRRATECAGSAQDH